MNEFVRTSLAEAGPFQIVGGAGAEPKNMMPGFAAVGGPIVGQTASIEADAGGGIVDLVVGHKLSMNIK